MDDELYFTCEVCGEAFPANADAMVECETSVMAFECDTKEAVELTEEQIAELLGQLNEDPKFKPFLKGAVCMCPKCQEKVMTESEDVTQEND